MSINTGTDISGLSANTQYTFSLYPINANGQQSTTVTQVQFTTLPAITSATVATATSYNSLALSIAGAYSSVYVEYSTDGSSYNTSGTTSTSPYTVSSLSENQRYYFKLTPYNSNSDAGTVAYISDTNAVTLGRIATFSAPTVDTSSVILNWTGIYSSAIIYYDTTSGTTTNSKNISTASTSTGTTNSYYIIGLNSGTTYYFTIYPYNSYGLEGASSTISKQTSTNFTELLRYTFETINGTIVKDTVNSYNGTASTASYYTSSYKYSGNYSMIASGNYVTLPTISYTQSKGLSFTFWMYQTSEPGPDQKFLEIDHDGGIYLFIDNPSGKLSISERAALTDDITNTQWIHIACTMEYISSSSHTFKIYKNGSLQGTASGNFSSNYPSSSTSITGGRIGRSMASGHDPFNGYIDDFRMFNDVLSSTIISSIYNGTT